MFKLIFASLFLVGQLNAKDFANPIALKAPDPWMVYHDGYYYLIATTFSNYFGIRKSKTIEGLKTVENKKVYEFSGSLAWAPEIHQVGDKWYLYYTSNEPANDDVWQHRNRVAESEGSDPMGPYKHKADFLEPAGASQDFELDPTLLKINNKLYLVGSYVKGSQGLYIRELSNPYTAVSTEKHILSTPTHPWETVGGSVNEGPEPLYHGNRTFIVFSASYCATPDYKLGLLEFTGTDPLNQTHWKKYPNPVFQRNDAHNVYGPGHNGFFKSPDGTEDWIVYHATESSSGGCDMNRSSRAQKFTWNTDGTPNFGVPDADGANIAVPAGEA